MQSSDNLPFTQSQSTSFVTLAMVFRIRQLHQLPSWAHPHLVSSRDTSSLARPTQSSIATLASMCSCWSLFEQFLPLSSASADRRWFDFHLWWSLTRLVYFWRPELAASRKRFLCCPFRVEHAAMTSTSQVTVVMLFAVSVLYRRLRSGRLFQKRLLA